KDPGIILSLCMAHVRRKFVDAKNSYSNAEEVLDRFDQLYDVEREAKDFAELGKSRLEKSSWIMNSILEWIKNQAGKYLENSPIGKAITHTLEHWERLNRFLTDPKIPLDNNSAERSQRRPVMGRRNFQGFRTINGADTGMFFYTIVETCKIIGISPTTYLLEMALRSLKGEELLSPYRYGLEIDAKVRAGVALHEALENIQ
ncbi:MAG TPA: transposase, partial [Oligoflexus sp.]|uniref:IS66 family transposase n=1 Tax=Oligoflexus sp. TaxID=1971216 RepID=UPI002D3EA675